LLSLPSPPPHSPPLTPSLPLSFPHAQEFSAKSPYEIGLAISCLASIATPELAENLIGDLVSMLTSSRPYIRKKATLVLYKLYIQYPQGLRLTFDNLKRRLSDDNPAVVSCAVNVICELARKKPSNYLSLAPDLFNLLTNSSNKCVESGSGARVCGGGSFSPAAHLAVGWDVSPPPPPSPSPPTPHHHHPPPPLLRSWMLIKVAKLMSALVQEEPRLARKLLEPLANIVQNTPAKSLLYECISTITFALQYTKKADGSDAKNAPAVVRLCTDRLREFVRDPDQNLKYLGLVGLVQLMKSNPRVVAEHRELVLQCLTDEDVTIRLRALELIAGMVTRRNLPDIVKSLLGHLETAEGHYRDELIDKIIFMCSRDKYGYLADFSWYVGVLAKLAFIKGTKHSATIAGQLLDVSVRVEDVRPFAVQTLLPMLADATLFQNARLENGSTSAAAGPQGGAGAGGNPAADGQSAAAAAAAAAADVAEGSAVATFSSGRAGAGQVLYAAAWVVGEYCAIIPAQMHGAVIDALLQPSVALLPPAVQAVYVQCALKVLAAAAANASKGGNAEEKKDAFLKLAASVLDRLHAFAVSADVEVQERACLVQQLLATLGVPFTPLPTPASSAAAKAKAEEDLLALLADGDEAATAAAAAAAASPSASTARATSALPPLDANMSRITAVLSSLFSEPLKPVNAKAQRKVAVPDGLDLDAWINPSEAKEEVEDKRTAFIYTSISFEDSYGVQDDEYAGSKEGGGREGRGGDRDGRGYAGKPFEGGVGSGADEDDDAWFDDLDKKNKRRDKELWGGDDDDDEGAGKKGKKGGKKGRKAGGAAADSDDEGKKKKKSSSGKRDPFMLAKEGSSGAGAAGSSSRSRGSTGAGAGADLDVDSIPIKTLDAGALKPNSLDVSIFGDFGKKAKAASSSGDGEKKKKKKKKGAADSDDEDDKPAGRNVRIMSDESFPEGAGDDDDDKGNDKSFDALANVDLSTPLGDHEQLPSRQHRSVGDPAALRAVGAKGKGRARVLGGDEAAAASSSSPSGDKKKKDKKDKKDKEEDGAAGKKDKKDKKDKSEPVAAAEEGGKKKKDKKSEEAPAAAAAAPAKKEKKSKGGEAAPLPTPTETGDEVAACPSYSYALVGDKVVKVFYSVSTAPVAGAAPSADGSYPSATGTCVVVVRVEPNSTKKALEWIDITVGASAGASVLPGPLSAGASAGSLRLAKDLKTKEKGKVPPYSKKAAFAVAANDPYATVELPVKISYQIAGGSAGSLEGKLLLRAASLLVPTAVAQEDYRAMMTTEGAAFAGTSGTVPFLGGDAEATMTAAMGMMRTFAVARNPKNAILFARSSVGTPFTALLKVDEAAKTLGVTVKSPAPGHAARILADVTEAFAAAAAAAGGKSDE
jgi:hypothetical protein